MKNAALSRALYKTLFEVKKHAPEILMISGIAGTVGSIILACKATTKISTITEEAKNTVDKIHETLEIANENLDYTEEDAKKDLTIVYVQTGIKLLKLYAPAIIMETASIFAMLASHNILKKRNAAIAAAYAAASEGFAEYRKRVSERYGEETEREIFHNIKEEEVEETIVDENGEESKKTSKVKTAEVSDFSVVFDKMNPYWENDPSYNRMFLRQQEQYANDLLKAKGYLTLYEVYKAIGVDEIVSPEQLKASLVVGWIYNLKSPSGDNYVDFGLQDAYIKAKNNEHNPAILMDFNVDGNIYNML